MVSAVVQCDSTRPVDCQRVAARVLAAELARPICDRTQNQFEQNMCIGPAVDTTNRNLAAFVTALETIVGQKAVQESQKAWLDYRKSQCDAVFELISPGTRAAAAQGLCEISLARSRMRDLDDIFDVPLHH